MSKMLKRNIQASDIMRISAILVFIGLLVLAAVMYTKNFGEVTATDKSGNFIENLQTSGLQMKEYIIAQYPKAGLGIMLFLQILLVMVAAIPSVLITFVTGMLYGTWGGLAVSAVGAAIGTAISFYLARLLGRKVLTLFISQKNIARMEKLIGGDTSAMVLLALFIIPSPKDFFSYFLGLTNMKASKYFLISAVGRIPTMLAASYLGTVALDRDPNWPLLIGCAAGAAVLFIVFFIFKAQLTSALNRKKSDTQ